MAEPTEDGIFTRAFWADATERAIKSAAQAEVLAGVFGAGFDLFAYDWKSGLSIGAAGAGLSLLTSIGSAPFGRKGTASLTSKV